MNGFPDIEVAIAPILVLGLGNMLLSDDGVGPALVGQFADSVENWNGRVEFLDGGTQGLALLGQLSGRQALIIVDAMKTGAPPGTIHRLTLAELREACPRRGNSGHEGNAGELLAAAQLIDQLPDRLYLVGIEPERIETGIGLSEAVQRALPEASSQINCLLTEFC
jgi:hydrogenase maturation protease